MPQHDNLIESVLALSVRTTGLTPGTDEVLEIGAAWLTQDSTPASRNRFINPANPPPADILRLNHWQPDQLAAGLSPHTAAAELATWLQPGTQILAHQGAFLERMLRPLIELPATHPILDTTQIARACFPFFSSHALDDLTESLRLPPRTGNRAEHDALATLQLWQAILEQAGQIPATVRLEARRLTHTMPRHPMRIFLNQACAGLPKSRNIDLYDTIEEETLPKPRATAAEPAPPAPLDTGEVDRIFAADGPFAERVPGFEHRPQQTDMARAVADAFNAGKHLMVEAGTGVGKSLAYLAPSVLWALANNVPVIVSTNTKNLQHQLCDKDLPLLRRVLDLDFKHALIKGRHNYLCLRKFLHLLHHADSELDTEDRAQMVAIMIWTAWTRTGDLSELALWGRPGSGLLFARLTSGGDECAGPGCRCRRKCFLYRARRHAMAADIVVANHSLVFAEMNIDSPALPPYEHIVFDEAHNLEDAATRHFSVELSTTRLDALLRRISHQASARHAVGTVHTVLRQFASGALKASDADQARAHASADRIRAAMDLAREKADTLFGALEQIVGPERTSETRRITPGLRCTNSWTAVPPARADFSQALKRLAAELGEFAAIADTRDEGDLAFQAEHVAELKGAAELLLELEHDSAFVLEAENEGFVSWIERTGTRAGGATAWAAPVDIGERLATELYAGKKTVIFSSATLTVRGSSSFVRRRLGTDRVQPDRISELTVGTPFDYTTQCRILAPTFLPEPTDQDGRYTDELADLLAEVFRRTHGRALALFTSYDMLRRGAGRLREHLLGDGIPVLAQGISGSRENITDLFRRNVGSVLLGTHSFWEGVDIVGQALSCLVVTRLPFAVFTHPVVEARCEQVEADGGNPFTGYSIPNAVIRFRQGFGRLIRHRDDRGIVIVTDKRLVTKWYGDWFRKSLPTRLTAFPDRDEFLDRLTDIVAELLPPIR